jgi:hypothetical protein
MSNSKISALTAATTPLAGTEVLPVVQSSTTKQVSVANLTVGRSVSGTNFIPSGSSAPTNGLYLPAANAVGIATNSTNAVYINSSQAVIVGATTADLYAQNTVNGTSLVPGTSANIQVANDPAGSTGNACVLLNFRNTPVSGAKYIRYFYNGSSEVGSISLNGSTGVLYNLTSDYRLKNNPVPVTGAKDFVMGLQPKTWDWWDNSGKGVGFIAHEFMEVAKYSGNGKKDEVDADGKPVYQTIQPSSSEVMANLVTFIQEQAETINALTARIAKLEVTS